MSRDEVIENLGTIAKSGTAQFLESLTGDQQKDSQLIGQFGVGFYSAFIVAERVEVLTRRAGSAAEEGVHWESAGEAEFSEEMRLRHRFIDLRREKIHRNIVLRRFDPQFADRHLHLAGRQAGVDRCRRPAKSGS